MSPTGGNRSGVWWSLVLVALFILSLDFWWWDGPIRFGPLHLPRWIYYFVLLQLLLAAAVHLFGRRHWAAGDGDDGSGNDLT